jgi:predicted RNA binding protein YcfA (HicA-like mRNA interferase family)
MPPVPLARPREVIRAFENLGWSVVRRKGSHVMLSKSGQMATLSVPDHALVARGTLRALITRAGITVEEFLRALAE